MEDIVSDEMDKQVNSYVRLAGKSKMKLQGCESAVRSKFKKVENLIHYCVIYIANVD